MWQRETTQNCDNICEKKKRQIHRRIKVYSIFNCTHAKTRFDGLDIVKYFVRFPGVTQNRGKIRGEKLCCYAYEIARKYITLIEHLDL